MIVAISGFWRIDELARFARLRTSAIVFALVALVGVLVLGILPGLVVAALLSLVAIVQQLSRPSVGVLARDPATGAWGRADRHASWEQPRRVIAARVDGPLFYANTSVVETRLLDLVAGADPKPEALVLDLSTQHRPRRPGPRHAGGARRSARRRRDRASPRGGPGADARAAAQTRPGSPGARRSVDRRRRRAAITTLTASRNRSVSVGRRSMAVDARLGGAMWRGSSRARSSSTSATRSPTGMRSSPTRHPMGRRTFSSSSTTTRVSPRGSRSAGGSRCRRSRGSPTTGSPTRSGTRRRSARRPARPS